MGKVLVQSLFAISMDIDTKKLSVQTAGGE